MIKIEKGIKLPLKKRFQERGPTSILRQMKINDSIRVRSERKNAYYMGAKYLKIKIATRAIAKNTIRIWRIK